ncbi:MAG: hypothetical protein NWE83_06570 [Candidatus Bathyarchaeota archaeon]|nr:hypothetical protein [Candidatus Bathyarchaeota archaeon]
MVEETITVAKAFQLGSSGSIAIIIPKRLRDGLGITKGNHYLVKKDARDRIIYEPIDNKPTTDDTSPKSIQEILKRLEVHQ